MAGHCVSGSDGRERKSMQNPPFGGFGETVLLLNFSLAAIQKAVRKSVSGIAVVFFPRTLSTSVPAICDSPVSLPGCAGARFCVEPAAVQADSACFSCCFGGDAFGLVVAHAGALASPDLCSPLHFPGHRLRRSLSR